MWFSWQEVLLPTPEDYSSNPATKKVFIENSNNANCRKDKITEKENDENGPLKSSLPFRIPRNDILDDDDDDDDDNANETIQSYESNKGTQKGLQNIFIGKS